MALTIDELNIQIAADSSNASRALTSLIKKLEKLKDTLNGTNVSNITISNSFNKVTNSTNKANTATKKYDSTTKKTSKSTKSFSDQLAQNISKWRTLTGVFKNAADKMASWFKESNDYIETLNLFNVTMGEGADVAYEYAESVQKLIGIDIAEWMNYQGTFKQLTSGFGVAEESANTMSQNLTQLSYDLASFFNTDVETAFDKLSSAMSGQVKGLREFGIDTTVASLEEYALAKGIDASVRSMTQAEKSLLRYNYIMENSIKIQGDMARTIVTPANALRILSAQFTQLKRAVGNIISVLVAKFIPYIQAFVRVVTDAANAVANLFGFEIPKIDYSGLGSGFADELEDGEDAVDGTSDALKKIKKQLMGFDELNIITNPDTGTDTGSSSGATSGSLGGMDLYEYDFLKDLEKSSDQIYKNIKKWLEPLKKLVTPMKKVASYLKDYEDTIVTIAGVIAGLTLLKKFQTLVTAIKGAAVVDAFLNGFSLIRVTGGNVFQSLVGGLNGIRQSLSGVQKFAIVAAAGILEFVAIKDSVKSLALGCEDVGAKIVTIGVVAGAAATAMYVALGPAGIALAAVVGIAGAIAGVGAAANELRSEFVETTVFDGYGIAIGDVTVILENLWSSIANNAGRINELGDKVKANDDIISSSQSGINTYMTNLRNAGTITKEQAKAMSEDVAALATAVKENIEYNANIVFESFATVSHKTAEQLGLDVGEMTRILTTFKNTFAEKTTELEGISQEYLTKLANGEVLSDAEMQDLENTLSYLNEMSGQTYANQEAIKRAMGDLTDINFGSVEEAKQAISDMAELGKQMNTDLDTAYENTLASIDTLMGQAKTMLKHGDLNETAYNSFAEVMANYKDGITAGYEQEKDNIKAQMGTVFDYIGAQVTQAGLDLYNDTQWSDLHWWQKLWYGNEYNYKDKVMKTFEEDISNPIFDALEEAEKTLEMQSSTMGRTTMNGFFDAVEKVANDNASTSYHSYKGLGANAIDGYVKGIEDNTKDATNAFKEMVQSSLDTVAKTQDSHSPSKEYWKLAKDAVDGYANGVKDNIDTILKSWKSGLTTIFSEIIKQAESVFSATKWSGYVNNISNALAKIKMPTFSSIGLSVSFDTWVSADKEKVYKALGLPGMPNLRWYSYATGGFPSVGEMFIAREAGPELVGSIGRKTAVANNDQIISGIESGVYRAMMAANSGNGGSSQTIRIINEIDGDVVGEKVIQYHNGKVIQTGVSPLLV